MVVGTELQDIQTVINRLHTKNHDYKEDTFTLDRNLRKLKTSLIKGHEDIVKHKEKVS